MATAFPLAQARFRPCHPPKPPLPPAAAAVDGAPAAAPAPPPAPPPPPAAAAVVEDEDDDLAALGFGPPEQAAASTATSSSLPGTSIKGVRGPFHSLLHLDMDDEPTRTLMESLSGAPSRVWRTVTYELQDGHIISITRGPVSCAIDAAGAFKKTTLIMSRSELKSPRLATTAFKIGLCAGSRAARVGLHLRQHTQSRGGGPTAVGAAKRSNLVPTGGAAAKAAGFATAGD